MLRETYPYYLAGRAEPANTDLVVTNKYTGQPACRVALADAGAIDAGIAAAVEAFEQTRRLPGYRRQAILQHVVERVTERQEELESSA